jgi:preprotein translocase SecE subunit
MARGNDTDNDAPKASASIPIPKSRRGAKGFFIDVQRELKRVNWPSRAENMRLTGVVLGVCVLMAIILTGMSWVASTFVDLVTKGHVGG